MNPFFLENGFIEKNGSGYLPTAPVIEFSRRHGWDAPTAAQALAPIVINSWFGQALTRRLHFRALSEDELVGLLAAQCQAGPEAKPQLRVLIDFCEVAGIIARADGKLANVQQDETPVQPNNLPRLEPELEATPEPVRPATFRSPVPPPESNRALLV